MSKTKIRACTLACLLLAVVIYQTHHVYRRRTTATEYESATADNVNATNWLKNWHDYEEIEASLNRTGLGEVGRPASFEDYRKELYNKYGFDALLSDSISLQRSVPDERPKACETITYLAKLPPTSIIIIFYNERLSILLRTIYGILNRTPQELLQEIILVDDASTWSDMHQELEQQLASHFPALFTGKLKLLRQPIRGGIMAARMSGARAASKASKALIFMDSHFEVGYNWLPPLLEPIAINPNTCTCPIIDRIAYDNFAYEANAPWRGYFDYALNYVMLPLHSEDYECPERNFKDYIMMGGAMAIGSDFFWHIGGFDEGMTHWGGEQFEMSFKIWMCGGQLLGVPCSRMGHLFRDTNTQGNSILYGDYSFVNRNYRRFLDVWVEPESRRYFFDRRPQLTKVDAGDLTTQFEIRERAQCKSFSWMMEHAMTHLHEVFLPVEPFDLASGLIRSVFDASLCMVLANETTPALEPCPMEHEPIDNHKQWRYTWRGELRALDIRCIECHLHAMEVILYHCHFAWGNQKWYYDRDKQWIMNLEYNVCILANVEERRIQLTACDVKNLKLKWSFGHMNFTEMDRWDTKLKMDLRSGLFF